MNFLPMCQRVHVLALMVLATLFGFFPGRCVQTLAAESATVVVTVTIGSRDNDDDGMADDWEVQNFPLRFLIFPSLVEFPVVVSPSADDDGDGVSNLHEFLLGTNPTDPDSLLQVVAISMTNGMARLTWTSSTRTAPLPRKYDVISHDSVEDFLESGMIIMNGIPSAGSHTEVTVPAGQGKFYAVKLADELFPQ